MMGFRRLRTLLVGVPLLFGGVSFAQTPSPPPPAPNPMPAEKLVDAKPGELRVFATAAIKLPLDAIRDKVRTTTGRPARIEYGSARGNLKTQILSGEAFDVAILLPDVVRDLRAQGKVQAEEYPIARIPVGIGLRGEVPSPDVSTAKALEATLLKARSVKYAPTGAARDTVDKILNTLRIADRINDSSALAAPVPLGPGEYEISLYPIGEILQNRDLRNLGLVPAPLQVPAQLIAVIAPGADTAAARAFIRFLRGPTIDPQLKAGGMVKSRR